MHGGSSSTDNKELPNYLIPLNWAIYRIFYVVIDMIISGLESMFNFLHLHNEWLENRRRRFLESENT